MPFDTSDADPDDNLANMHSITDAGPRLRSVMSWHPADHEKVRHALAAAVDALVERASSSRYILDDPDLYGLADPARLRRQTDTDDLAAGVLRLLLQDGTQLRPR